MNTKSPAGLGLRERKKLAARAALSEAAMRLALDRGFEHVLVEDIAREVGVTSRTFNNYFSSKEEAIVSLAFARAAQVQAALAARPADEPLWDALGHAFAEVYPFDDEWRHHAQLVRNTPVLAAEQFKAFAAIERALAEEIARRIGADSTRDVYPRLAGAAAVTAIRVAVDHYLDNDPDGSFLPVLGDVLRRIGAGLPEPEQRPRRADRP